MAGNTQVRRYTSERDMAREVEALSQQGWRVVSQSAYTPRRGCLRTIAGGGLFFNKKPVTTVTYARESLG